MSKQDQHCSSEALFRLSVIWQVLNRMRLGEPSAAAVATAASHEHVFFDGTSRSVSERSIYRWLKLYRESDVAGLEPAERSDAPVSTVLPQAFIDFLVREKELDKPVSVPELIRRGRELGYLDHDRRVDRSTVYRTCRRLGLMVARGKSAKHRDARRFAYPHRMDMVLCDGKFFRAGPQRQKRLAYFYICDCTRCLLHAVVGTVQCAELFLRGLYECVCKYGLMDSVYLDHGSGFIAEDTYEVVRNLGAALIFGQVAYKEGHGKIERFNRTANGDVLRTLDGRPDVDPSCAALELRLQHYCDKQYNHRPHESLGQDSPWQRFSSDPKPLRFPADREALRSKFEIRFTRRVSNDNTVSIGNTPYDVPSGHRGDKVVLWRRLLQSTIGFVHEGRVIDLQPTDLEANARTPRARSSADAEETTAIPPKSAADYAFERDFGPVADADGGYQHPGDDLSDDSKDSIK